MYFRSKVYQKIYNILYYFHSASVDIHIKTNLIKISHLYSYLLFKK